MKCFLWELLVPFKTSLNAYRAETELKHSLKGEVFLKYVSNEAQVIKPAWTIGKKYLTHFRVQSWQMCAGWGICVFYLEEVVNMVLGSIIPHVGVGVLPHHVIDGVHDSCHLLDGGGGGGGGDMHISNITSNYQHNIRHNFHTNSERENSLSTSLVMQPSLFRSYRLKAQLSLSVIEPLRMMDRLMTKS